MLSSFRRLSKSTVGTIIMVLFLVAILASFAMADIKSVATGGFGVGGGALAEAGDLQVTERDLSQAMTRQLAQVRQQNPEADYASLAGSFDPMMNALIQDRALMSFGADNGLVVSKRLVDAEIANLPATRGLDGKFSEAGYQNFLQQQKMTDAELRRLLTSAIAQRLLLTPAVANPRVPVGLATPFAAMLLESRQGLVATIASDRYRAGLNPTEAQVQQFYASNRTRYMVPEQRSLRIASLDPAALSAIQASDQEIAAAYAADQATYGGKVVRVISQAIVPSKTVADGIATRARAGAFAAAAAPAGLSAADISVGPQSLQQFTALAGDKVAAAAFAAAPGAIVGPIQSDLGWHVIKIESVRKEAGTPLAAARSAIAAKLTAAKRKDALTDMVTKVEDMIDGGSSFAEAAAAAHLSTITTPPVTASGIIRSQANAKLPAQYLPALKSGFDLAQDDDPVVEALPNDSGFLLVGVDRVLPAAPAPLASIRAQVVGDWIARTAAAKAEVVAKAVAAKIAAGVPMAKAMADAGLGAPEPLAMRRIDMNQFGAQVPAPVRLLFTLPQGKSRMAAAPEGRGYFVTQVMTIIPGNPLLQPGLIARTEGEFNTSASDEIAQQFLTAVGADQKVARNPKAIAEARARIIGGASQ